MDLATGRNLVVTRSDVLTAHDRIAGSIRRTPTLRITDPTHRGSVWFKQEYQQYSGSFKVRGATNRILAAAEAGQLTDAGVIAASGGNAGLAVAYVARNLKARAEVYVPVTAPPNKVSRLRGLGAEVTQVGSEYAEAYEAARLREAETGALFCHAYDHFDMVAGNGTLGLELQEDIGQVDTVIVAVGGGGLIAGIAAAMDGTASIIAAEPRTAPTMHAALAAGRPVTVDVGGIAADSLGARQLGGIAFEVAQRFGVRSLLVSDEDVIAARQLLWDDYRILVEHGAATALAVLLGGYYEPSLGERVVVVLCGANTDPRTLSLA
jgi:threonine dehydratase